MMNCRELNSGERGKSVKMHFSSGGHPFYSQSSDFLFQASCLTLLRGTLRTSREVDKNTKKTEMYRKQTIHIKSYVCYRDICALSLCTRLSHWLNTNVQTFLQLADLQENTFIQVIRQSDYLFYLSSSAKGLPSVQY